MVRADRSSVSPVSQLLGSVSASVQQDAVRGLALILKQQGDIAAAKQLLAGLVQSEGPACTSQHLAEADYGSLLLHQGDLQVMQGTVVQEIHTLCQPTRLIICAVQVGVSTMA